MSAAASAGSQQRQQAVPAGLKHSLNRCSSSADAAAWQQQRRSTAAAVQPCTCTAPCTRLQVAARAAGAGGGRPRLEALLVPARGDGLLAARLEPPVLNSFPDRIPKWARWGGEQWHEASAAHRLVLQKVAGASGMETSTPLTRIELGRSQRRTGQGQSMPSTAGPSESGRKCAAAPHLADAVPSGSTTNLRGRAAAGPSVAQATLHMWRRQQCTGLQGQMCICLAGGAAGLAHRSTAICAQQQQLRSLEGAGCARHQPLHGASPQLHNPTCSHLETFPRRLT